jgi:hypothetical protein
MENLSNRLNPSISSALETDANSYSISGPVESFCRLLGEQTFSDANLDNLNRKLISDLDSKSVSINFDGEIIIKDVFKSIIKLSGTLSSVTIVNAKNCRIEFLDICKGPVYIDSSQSSIFLIAGDQIRTHRSLMLNVVLFCKSSCIIEDCEKLKFFPYKSMALKDNVMSYWKCVNDFGFNVEESFVYATDDDDDDDYDLLSI